MLNEEKQALHLLGARLQKLRKAGHLTQEQVGEAAGISAQYLSDIERGRRNPPFLMLRRIASAMGSSLGLVVESTPLDPRVMVAEPVATYGLSKPLARIVSDLRAVDSDEVRLVAQIIRAHIRLLQAARRKPRRPKAPRSARR